MTFHFQIKDLFNDRMALEPFTAPIHAPTYFALSYPHPDLYAHLTAGPFASLDAFLSYIKKFDQSDPSNLLYAIIDKTRPPSPESPSGALAGLIAFQDASLSNLSFEIGPVIILPAFQRTHVASNAIGLLLQYALDPKESNGLGLRRVQWDCSTENTTSMRVAERMALVKEGVLRWRHVYRDGIARGKVGNGKGVPNGGAEGDLGRDTVIYGLCWDHWEDGGREKVQAVMDRR
ncbi:MAG: hypothetical protein ASARMPRED_005825 [Alectoria sarmentosa]|nr:MAG: hypothetical protein ASARMPRED_005825 [Alectoria sarmentosa]